MAIARMSFGKHLPKGDTGDAVRRNVRKRCALFILIRLRPPRIRLRLVRRKTSDQRVKVPRINPVDQSALP